MPLEFTWTIAADPATPAETTPDNATGAALFGATALRDKALDPVDGDLLQVDGDQVFNFGIDGIVSDLLARLQTFAREFFLDTSIGVDYLGSILQRFADLGALRAEFTREILDCPGVVELISLEPTLDRAARQASISFEARADTGDVIARTLLLNFTAGA